MTSNGVARRGGFEYRMAVVVALGAVLLLGWVSGAVGIIGSENQPANLLYFGVVAIGLIGVLLARFRSRGMSLAMFVMAFAQILVPVLALIIWPQVSWGGVGMAGVFALNAFFAALLVGSAVLFRRAP